MNPQGERVADFILRVSDLLRRANIPPHELRAMMAIAQQPEYKEQDIEEVRREAIERCNMYGKTVLDIGGYDGWAAKMALDRGAKRAICLDNHQYEHYGWKDVKKEGVEYIKGDVMDLKYRPARPFEDHGTCAVAGELEHLSLSNCENAYLHWPIMDVLINYNVLYHTKNPWAFLDRCREIIADDGEMLLCTLFRYHDGPWMYVYNPRECNPTDETVYFGPSLAALERLLEHTGWEFEQTGLALDRVVYRCKPVAGWQRRHEDT
jgi:SAM-dependent methyltransferase